MQAIVAACETRLMWVTRPFREGDTDACYDVCLRTADEGGDASALHTDPRIVGDIWVGPYLVRHPECAVVVEDDEGVCGYVVGAPDTTAYDRWVEEEWFPPLRARYPVGSFSEGTADEQCVRLIHSPQRVPASVIDEYPAHLHIDLLPRAQGRGLGLTLMDAFLERMRAADVPAIHLRVSPTNTGAVAFYQRLGFVDLIGGFVWGRSTEPIRRDRTGPGGEERHVRLHG